MPSDSGPEDNSQSPKTLGDEIEDELQLLDERFLSLCELPNYFHLKRLFPAKEVLEVYRDGILEFSLDKLPFSSHINLIVGQGNYLCRKPSSIEKDYVLDIEDTLYELCDHLSDAPVRWPESFKTQLKKNVLPIAGELAVKVREIHHSGRVDVTLPIRHFNESAAELGDTMRKFHRFIEIYSRQNR